MGEELVSREKLDESCRIVVESRNCVRTPLLRNVEKLGFVECREDVHVHLKLENMQITGSFKARGVACQMAQAPSSVTSGERRLVTMSAGNYGKAFAYFCRQMELKGTVVMPETAPQSREVLIRGLGCDVIRVPSPELMTKVNELVTQEGMTFLHPFDDVNIISGYGSVAVEILDDVIPDVVLVCCGGGGLLSGVASAVHLRGHRGVRVYGVEPDTANTMQRSFEENVAAFLPSAHSVASGLAPPFAGSLCYQHARAFANGILTVSDREIAAATRALYSRGLVVEPSGAAAFAALMFNKVPELRGNVVVMVTGGNVTPEELTTLFTSFDV